MRTTFEDRLLLIVLAVTLAAAMLLISAGRGVEEGHRPWQPGSTLHFVTRLLNFDYAYPTPKGVTVKRLAGGAGAAAALIIAAAMWCRRHSPRTAWLSPFAEPSAETAPRADTKPWHTALSAVDAAQFAMLAFVAWSFASAMWSAWRDVALGESALVGMGVVWAVCLGRGLSRRAATVGAAILTAVLSVTAIIALWYFFERNPHQRLKFPIGNPLFLGACLVPGVLLAMHFVVGSVSAAITQRRWLGLLWAPLAAAALVPLLWAFRLTGARGALVGLCAGLWTAVFIKVRGIGRWLAILLALAGLYGLYWYAHTKINDLEGGRGATIRLRLYGSQYAWRLFLKKPAIGLGQGGFSLVADSLSRGDAENDPAAFVGERFVHAHNEWLENLADLGAVGIALLAVGYGVTFWAGRQILRQQGRSLQGWCLLGLVAALAALMTEEATDVAIRYPGLPIVWYTVLGLAWAMMRGEDRPSDRATPFPRPVLWMGTGAAFAIAIIMLAWTVGDWEASLAEARIRPALNERRWADAAVDADTATQYRLAPDEITAAYAERILCDADIAGFHLGAVQASAQGRPLKDTEGTPLGDLQRQDLATARSFIFAAHTEAGLLLNRSPSYPYVAGEVGRLLLYWVQVAGELGSAMTTAEAKAALNEGKSLILIEYNRNPLNVEAALRCIAAWPDRPIDDRIEWLCTALRGCPVPTGSQPLRTAAIALMNDPGFEAALGRRMQLAQASAAAARSSEWQDRFAPETLRLSAIMLSARSEWSDAARMAEQAARMYNQIRVAQPAMLPIALAEQAWYVFRADPNHPQEARQLSLQAIAKVPPIGSREQLAEPIRRSLILYCLADGDEAAAAPIVATFIGSDDRQAVSHELGGAYVELAASFIGEAAADRPKRFAVWLDRAGQLAPDSGTLQLILAQVAFETGRDADVVEALKKGESLGVEPERIDNMLQRAVARRPESKPLTRFAEERRKASTATAPAERPPEPASRPTTSAVSPAD